MLCEGGICLSFTSHPMRAQVLLLETLVNLWDHDLGLFDLQGETLELMIEDIYFIMGLLHRGETVNMEVQVWK